MFGDIGRDQPPCLTLAILHGDAAHLEPTTDVVQIERLGHHHVAVTEDLHRLDEKRRRHAPPRPELRLRRFGLGLKHDYRVFGREVRFANDQRVLRVRVDLLNRQERIAHVLENGTDHRDVERSQPFGHVQDVAVDGLGPRIKMAVRVPIAATELCPVFLVVL